MPHEVPDCGQPRPRGGRVRHAQAAAIELQPPERRQAGHGRRKRTAQFIAAEVQVQQTGETSQLGRNLPAQQVAIQRQSGKADQVAECGGNGAGQCILVQGKPLEVGQTSQRCRDRTRQPVLLETHPVELRQIAQRRRDVPSQPRVAPDLQPLQMGQRPELGRQPPGQPVANVSLLALDPSAEAQTDDAALLIRFDPVPVPERFAAQPVGIVGPVVPARRAVDRLQRRAVRLRASLRPGIAGRGAQAGGEREHRKEPHVYGKIVCPSRRGRSSPSSASTASGSCAAGGVAALAPPGRLADRVTSTTGMLPAVVHRAARRDGPPPLGERVAGQR